MSLASMMRDLSNRLTRTTGSLKEEILKLRAGIEATRSEFQHVERGPLPIEEVVAKVIPAAVDEMREWWLKEHAHSLVRGERCLCAPGVTGSRKLPWGPFDSVPWGALCAGEPDRAAKLLETLTRAAVQCLPDYKPGPQSVERPALIARLKRELAEEEAAEEKFIDEAIAAGLATEHRHEVVQRRQAEDSKRKQDDSMVADRRRREAAINAAHTRIPGGPVPSPYLQRENAERQALHNG